MIKLQDIYEETIFSYKFSSKRKENLNTSWRVRYHFFLVYKVLSYNYLF